VGGSLVHASPVATPHRALRALTVLSWHARQGSVATVAPLPPAALSRTASRTLRSHRSSSARRQASRLRPHECIQLLVASAGTAATCLQHLAAHARTVGERRVLAGDTRRGRERPSGGTEKGARHASAPAAALQLLTRGGVRLRPAQVLRTTASLVQRQVAGARDGATACGEEASREERLLRLAAHANVVRIVGTSDARDTLVLEWCDADLAQARCPELRAQRLVPQCCT
jgi:hypothetical protein